MSTKKHTSKNSSRRNGKRNNNLVITAAVLVVVVIAIVILVNGKGSQQPAADTLPVEITVVQAYEKYQEGTYFLDVREQDEWDSFHIPNTTLIPLGELQTRLGELPQDRPIVVVCRSGNRSQAGRDILLEAGFQDVTSMAGGVTQWSNLGYPIEGTRP